MRVGCRLTTCRQNNAGAIHQTQGHPSGITTCIYYCKSVPLPEELRDKDIRDTYPKIQYNLYRRSFDLASHDFGEEELVYDAASADKSVTLPRISPDGHYLLFALGQYGCFHSRHHDADIVCIPMDQYAGTALTAENSSAIDLTLLNSDGYSDSYFKDFQPKQFLVCLLGAIGYVVLMYFFGFYISTVIFMATRSV